jgi:hypothetical protein
LRDRLEARLLAISGRAAQRRRGIGCRAR